jgi:hypothetical protein
MAVDGEEDKSNVAELEEFAIAQFWGTRYQLFLYG